MCPFSNIYLDFHQEIWKDALIDFRCGGELPGEESLKADWKLVELHIVSKMEWNRKWVLCMWEYNYQVF